MKSYRERGKYFMNVLGGRGGPTMKSAMKSDIGITVLIVLALALISGMYLYFKS